MTTSASDKEVHFENSEQDMPDKGIRVLKLKNHMILNAETIDIIGANLEEYVRKANPPLKALIVDMSNLEKYNFSDSLRQKPFVHARAVLPARGQLILTNVNPPLAEALEAPHGEWAIVPDVEAALARVSNPPQSPPTAPNVENFTPAKSAKTAKG